MEARSPNSRLVDRLGASAPGLPRWAGAFVRRATGSEPRTRRIVLLLAAIFVMSLFDLLLTLTYLQGVGMVEANPLARKVMQHGSPGLLAAWKLGIVGGACLVVFLGRRARVAEIGAWLACMALMALTVHWVRYIDAASELTPYLDVAEEIAGGHWLAMTPE